MTRMNLRIGALALAIFPLCDRAPAQFHEKKEARIAASEKPQNVHGGATFQVSTTYGSVYAAILNHLKREGYSIDSASAETGQITTALEIKGGYRQTGTRIQVTCIKDADTQTTVRVLVTDQHRTKLLQTEPWNGAKANELASSKLADQIKMAIQR